MTLEYRVMRGLALALVIAAVTYSSVSAQRNSKYEQDWQTETRELNERFVYSKMATIVPDPEHLEDKAARDKLVEERGKWKFYDGEEDNRPQEDYCADFPYRDIPGDKFPDGAWQSDAVYVNHIIDAGMDLVDRTIDAILDEYGWGKVDISDREAYAKRMQDRLKIYHWEMVNMTSPDAGVPEGYTKGKSEGGGWTTRRSVDGMVRRLLHAMMTNDSFTVVLGGHSAAAGHGNHFRQSYMMQFHKVMAPVFARLGVKLVTRNLAQGGLGTIQNAMGMKSIYGDEIDLLLWDSGMTESDQGHIEYYFRQALLSGNRVPVIWGGPFATLRLLHENADADVGFLGEGQNALIEVTSEAQASEVPYASRYMKCSKDAHSVCAAAPRFCATCWIETDAYDKSKFNFIDPKVKSQVKWHPGWRPHQMKGRMIALAILDALQQALEIWSEGTQGGPPLDEDLWHVSDYYKNIQDKAKSLPATVGACHSLIDQGLSKRICNTAMEVSKGIFLSVELTPVKARSLYTPRANPRETSVLTLVKADADGRVPPPPYTQVYESIDVHNQCSEPKEGTLDVLQVVSNRQLIESAEVQSKSMLASKRSETSGSQSPQVRSRRLEEITVGKGWQHIMEYPGNCDGTYDASCAKHREDACPLLGHHDSRGHLAGNEYSGWLVLTLPKVEKGLIMLKIVTWLGEASNTYTDGWTSVNNQRRLGASNDQQQPSANSTRRLGLSDQPEELVFEYSVDGVVTSLSKTKLVDEIKKVQRLVEIVTVLDEESFGVKENVEVAFRLKNCGRQCTFGLTHVYWA